MSQDEILFFIVLIHASKSQR